MSLLKIVALPLIFFDQLFETFFTNTVKIILMYFSIYEY